jgi:hypothetical protein
LCGWEKRSQLAGSGIGRYGKDAPYPLVTTALDARRRITPFPGLILFSDDFPAHDFRNEFIMKTQKKAMATTGDS